MPQGGDDTIFLVGGDEDLRPMKVRAYDNEDQLQNLIALHPDLLAGAQMTPDDPRRFLLVQREMGVPWSEDSGDWLSADHLFVDQAAMPTIVEVKRATDTRIRREVVGQMLDYAANGAKYWSGSTIRAAFEGRCSSEGLRPDDAMGTLGPTDGDLDAFWAQVESNLRDGRLRMVFVADQIPQELRSVVEFLNEGLGSAECFAVEIAQFVGSGQRALVPRLIGATQRSVMEKRHYPGFEIMLAAGPHHVREVDQLVDQLVSAVDETFRDRTTPTEKVWEFDVAGETIQAFRLSALDEGLMLSLGLILDVGEVDAAAALLSEAQAICSSKKLPAKYPYLPTADLVQHQEEAGNFLERYLRQLIQAMVTPPT